MAKWILDEEEDAPVDINEDIEASPLTDQEKKDEEQAWPTLTQQDFSKELDQAMSLQDGLDTAPDAMSKLAEPSMPENPQLSAYKSIVDSYRDLLRNRRSDQANIGMLAGAQQIGQSIAGGTSGNFKVDNSNIKMLQDMANQRVEDYSSEVKQKGIDISLRDMEQMRDPASTISKFYRELAKKRNMPVEDNMSAWDLAQMAKTGFGQAKSGQIIRRTNPQTGTIELGIFNPSTQSIEWTGETAGFAGQVRQDPRTKELISVNPATSSITKQLTAPEALPKEREPAPLEVYKNLSPADQSKVDDISKEFNSETKDQRTSFEKIDSLTEQKIDLATKNEIAASQLGAEVATIFENGRLTDEDVLRYTRRRGVVSRMSDLASELGRGVINKEKAAEIKQTLQVYKQALNEKLRQRADQKASTIANRLQKPVSPKQLTNLIYNKPFSSLAPNEERRVTKDGRKAIFDRGTKQFIRYEE